MAESAHRTAEPTRRSQAFGGQFRADAADRVADHQESRRHEDPDAGGSDDRGPDRNGGRFSRSRSVSCFQTVIVVRRPVRERRADRFAGAMRAGTRVSGNGIGRNRAHGILLRAPSRSRRRRRAKLPLPRRRDRTADRVRRRSSAVTRMMIETLDRSKIPQRRSAWSIRTKRSHRRLGRPPNSLV